MQNVKLGTAATAVLFALLCGGAAAQSEGGGVSSCGGRTIQPQVDPASQTAATQELAGAPSGKATIEIRLASDGKELAVTLATPSGDHAFDAAVLRYGARLRFLGGQIVNCQAVESTYTLTIARGPSAPAPLIATGLRPIAFKPSEFTVPAGWTRVATAADAGPAPAPPNLDDSYEWRKGADSLTFHRSGTLGGPPRALAVDAIKRLWAQRADVTLVDERDVTLCGAHPGLFVSYDLHDDPNRRVDVTYTVWGPIAYSLAYAHDAASRDPGAAAAMRSMCGP